MFIWIRAKQQNVYLNAFVLKFILLQAYARAPVLTINGGNGGFDGYRS